MAKRLNIRALLPHLEWCERETCLFLAEHVPHDWYMDTPAHFYHHEQVYRSGHDERLAAHGYFNAIKKHEHKTQER